MINLNSHARENNISIKNFLNQLNLTLKERIVINLMQNNCWGSKIIEINSLNWNYPSNMYEQNHFRKDHREDYGIYSFYLILHRAQHTKTDINLVLCVITVKFLLSDCWQTWVIYTDLVISVRLVSAPKMKDSSTPPNH